MWPIQDKAGGFLEIICKTTLLNKLIFESFPLHVEGSTMKESMALIIQYFAEFADPFFLRDPIPSSSFDAKVMTGSENFDGGSREVGL